MSEPADGRGAVTDAVAMAADAAALARAIGEPLSLPPSARPGNELARAAHRRTDAGWLAQAWVDAHVVLVDENGRAPVRDDPPGLVLTPADEVDGDERYFLGVDGTGRAYFAVSAPFEAPEGTRK